MYDWEQNIQRDIIINVAIEIEETKNINCKIFVEPDKKNTAARCSKLEAT